ncbi:hypothetical protein GTU73_09475 [Rathayibacter sp. VKM Ac-2804]|uniref:aggregation-promoting factor C-terminal-like domain-containing protein n=1 Tax=Rathayibacter sp. VKM Ac-2804 TaxID=2609257 RepID=UPI00132F46FD|nr:hypothetical protein [Rathayibacter sp. VKM Ac-2804]QHF24218.1 hypothetical protein GTU73_09475 [Rathayibacter sp. VKM Ac-2804]
MAPEPPEALIEHQQASEELTASVSTAAPAIDAEAEAKAFVYQHESGNRPDAINPRSGACGIGQALPCSKLPCALSDYACQDEWFTSYMRERYGSWVAAAAYWSCTEHCTNNYGTVFKENTWW